MNVHVFNQRSVAQILDMILVLGSLVGATDKAGQLVNELEQGLAAVRRETSGWTRRPRWS